MITELSFENFKVWKAIRNMRLAPITGIFGSNSSGKTSILQVLLMLKQTVESADRAQALIFGDEKSPASLGTFQDVMHGHVTPGTLPLDIKWRTENELQIPNPANVDEILFRGKEYGFHTTIQGENGRVIVKKMHYKFGSHTFGMKKKDENSGKYELMHIGHDFKFIREHGRSWELPAPFKCYGFPDQVKAYYQNAGFLSDLQLAFENLFNSVFYLGPLREYPKRQYAWAGSEPADMGQRGERVIDALLASRNRGRYISRGRGRGKNKHSMEEHLASWLRDLGLIHAFNIEPISKDSNLYRIKVQKSPHSEPVLITDVGFGVSQILPVLVICYYVPEGSTIILEQPEIHLHPAVQAGLADVFIDAMKYRNIQIIFESHSEHLLKRLQRRIAEEALQTKETALYFAHIENGKSRLEELNLDLFGNIANWPKDFFGDEFGEMAAMTKAAMQRKATELK